MTDSRGLSWEAQEVLQKIKSFNRLPGAGIPLIQLRHRRLTQSGVSNEASRF